MACNNGNSSLYPDFVPNQILTYEQLNQLRDYLEREDRRARVRLVGTGIVCGLNWRWSRVDLHLPPGAGRDVLTRPGQEQVALKDEISVAGGTGGVLENYEIEITVDEGFGITPGGHLIELPGKTYSHYRTYDDPDYEGESWPAAGAGESKILELLEDDAQDGARPLRRSNASSERMLVLYLERKPVELRSCLVTDCNDKGRDIHLNVRALLVPKTTPETPESCDKPSRVRIARYHTPENLAPINDTWATLIADHVLTVRNAILQAFTEYGDFLDLDSGSYKHSIRRFMNHLKADADDGKVHQYHYDLLKDLATACNEMVAAACELIRPCCRHQDFSAAHLERTLMLGAFDAAPGFRHDFLPSPVRNVYHADLERVKTLFLRLVKMVEAFDPDFNPELALDGVRLTPSHTEAHPLAARAVPAYYDLGKIGDYWQPYCTAEPLWSYHNQPEGDLTDLDFDYNLATFLRIEGHLGLDCALARDLFPKLRQQHNAELDFLVVHLGDPFAGEEALREAVIASLAGEAAKRQELQNEKPDPGPILRLATQLGVLEQETADAVASWAEARRSRPLECDAGALFADYHTAGGALRCRLHQLLGELATLEPVLPAGAPEPTEGWRTMLLERMVALLMATRELDAALRKEVRQVLKSYQSWTLKKCAERALSFALRALREGIRRLLDALPFELDELSYEVFAVRYREMTSDLFVFWLLWQGRDVTRQAGAEDAATAALALWRGCPDARITAVYFAYQELHHHDPSGFSNLAARVDGLEHLGGVEKGGSFVMVCEEGRIIADFSLAGRLPCCCEVDLSELALPLVAISDVRVIRLERDSNGEFQEVEIDIDVLENDYDPARDGAVDAEELTAKPVSETTLLGGNVTGENLLHYTFRNPQPALVDRFTYRLTQQDSDRAALGEVLILMTAEPHPVVVPGTIHGQVSRGGQPLIHLAVRLSTGPETLTNDMGWYSFANLAPGRYTVTVGDLSRSTTVTAGATVRLDFELPALPGAIVGTVVDSAGNGVPGVTVVIEDGGESTISARNGAFSFPAVAAGTYKLNAVLEGWSAGSEKVTVRDGETASVTIVIDPVAPAGTGDVLVGVRGEDQEFDFTTGVVTLRQVDGDFEQIKLAVPPGGKAFAFTAVPAGISYRVSAFKLGYQLRWSEGFTFAGGETFQVSITLPRSSIVVTDGFVSTVADGLNLRPAEVRAKAEEVYGARYGQRLRELTAAGEDAATRRALSYQAAARFVSGTLADARLSDEEVGEVYDDTAGRLLESLSTTTPQRREVYSGLLVSVSLALIDRLTLTHPTALDPAARAAVERVAGNLRRAEVDVERFRKQWDGPALARELKVTAVDGVLEALG